MERPLLTSAVRGYRAFYVKQGRLHALTRGTWEKGLNKARCQNFDHHAPADQCHCGFNLYHNLQSAENLAEANNFYVLALVAAKGDIEVHEMGIRAEEAQILALAPTYHEWGLRSNDLLESPHPSKLQKLRQLADYYQVPLLQKEELLDYLPEVRPFSEYKDNIHDPRESPLEKKMRRATLVGNFLAIFAMVFSILRFSVQTSFLIALGFILFGLSLVTIPFILEKVKGLSHIKDSIVDRLLIISGFGIGVMVLPALILVPLLIAWIII